MEDSPVQEEPVCQTFGLRAREELRFETEGEEALRVRVDRGTCEMAGVELAKNTEYAFAGAKGAFFTWTGCSITLLNTDACSLFYVSDETPAMVVLNVFDNLEVMRRTAQQGPRVLVVGPPDTGKSVVAETLVNYSARKGHRVIFADLDVDCNAIAVPGSVAASPIARPKELEAGYTGVFPISYFYGYTSPSVNKEHYLACVELLAKQVQRRLQAHPEEGRSGLVINTGGWTEALGVDAVADIAEAFGATIVLVVGHERLHAQLKRVPLLQDCSVVNVPKSGGVVGKDARFRRHLSMVAIRRYFYGEDNDLSPHQSIVRFNDVGIYQVGGAPAIPTSALPIGETRLSKTNQVLPVTPSMEFSHSVLAISQAETPEELLSAPVAGYVYVTHVDTKKKLMTLLTPSTADLPTNCLLFGSIKWFDK